MGLYYWKEKVVVINRLCYHSFLTVLFFVIYGTSFGQTKDAKPILERTITLKVTNERVDAILNKVALQGGFNFSYNPAIIDVSRIHSGYYVKKPVREVLNGIFEGKIEYKEKGQYLILQKGKEKSIKEEPKESVIFSGYVRDEKGELIPYASIYDKVSLESTVSNIYGYYKIRFYLKQLPLTLYFSKVGFVDTTIYFDAKSPEFLNVELRRVVPPVVSVPPKPDPGISAEETASSFFKNLETTTNAKNISDTIYRKYQFSLIPYIGTNGRLSGNVINDYSLNVFGGYSLGIRKAELAGFFNLNRGDVGNAQIAGFVNLNGGQVKGAQIAGFTNLVKGKVNGCQVAGFVNLDWNDFEGLQLAGYVNVVKGKTNGAQISGFTNIALDSVKGVQLTGFCNVAKKSVIGTQLSGFCNVALDSITGTQISFVNYANHINGGQLGFINYASSTNGIPVGFLSYVHNGYHKVEFSADEVFPVNIALRTGVTAFHNILTSGIHPFYGDSLLWNFGYGVGSSITLSPKTLLDIDLTCSQAVKGNTFDKINLLNKLYLGIDTRIGNKISLATGLTLNGQLTKTDYNSYPDIYTYYQPNIFYSHTWELDQTKLQMWLGAKVALRFF